MRKDVKIFLDSGAPSLYNTLMRQDKGAGHMGSYLGDRKHDDFSYIETIEYKEYMDNYISFIQEHDAASPGFKRFGGSFCKMFNQQIQIFVCRNCMAD